MRKIIFCMAALAITSIKVKSQQNPKEVWSDVIEIDQGILQRHVVYDLPGAILILIPTTGGKFESRIFGNKVLKNNNKMPELVSKPTVLVSDVATKTLAGSLGYLSFASASMSDTDEIRFTITETSYSSILDNDIDWPAFNERIALIKEKNPSLPKGTMYAVVKVASIITIDNQRFKKVQKAANISGWGFASEAKALSETSAKRLDFKVGVAVTFSDEYIGGFGKSVNKDGVLKSNPYGGKSQLTKELLQSIKSSISGVTTEVFNGKIENR